MSPDAIAKLRSRQNTACVGQQTFQKTKLGRRQSDFAAAALHPHCLAIDANVACSVVACSVMGSTAPQQSMDAGDKFGDGEWLDHVVVSADGKATHAVVFLAARRHHDNRQQPRPLASRRRRQFPSLTFRAASSRGRRGRTVLTKETLHLVAAPDAFDGETLGFQIVGEHLSKNEVVLDDEDIRNRRGAHGRRAAQFVHDQLLLKVSRPVPPQCGRAGLIDGASSDGVMDLSAILAA